MTVGPAQRAERVDEPPGRIRVQPTVARMGVRVHHSHPQQQRLDPFQPQHDYRTLGFIFIAGLPHAPIKRAQQGRMVGRELGEVGAADLLLAFEDAGQAQRKLADGRAVRLHRSEASDHVALVIGNAARIQDAVDNRRVKRRHVPLVQGIRRLHVVVVVNHQAACARAPLRQNYGWAAAGRHEFDLQPDAGRELGDVRRGLVHRRPTYRRDARDAAQRLQLRNKLAGMLFHIRIKMRKVALHGCCHLSRIKSRSKTHAGPAPRRSPGGRSHSGTGLVSHGYYP